MLVLVGHGRKSIQLYLIFHVTIKSDVLNICGERMIVCKRMDEIEE
jgi:hypothetical protein